MRNRWIDLFLVIGWLTCLSATLVLSHRARVAAAAQQQRQAAATECEAQVLAAIQQTSAFQSSDPLRALSVQCDQLGKEAQRQLSVQRAVDDELRRAREEGIDLADLRDLLSRLRAQQLVVTSAVRR